MGYSDFLDKDIWFDVSFTSDESRYILGEYKKLREVWKIANEHKYVLRDIPNSVKPLIDDKYTEFMFRILEHYDKYDNNFDVDFQKIDSTPRIAKFTAYTEGGEYKLHTDFKSQTSRNISIVTYLNDDYEGGITYFPRQDLEITPVAGYSLAFPSYYTHPHKGSMVLMGDKYILYSSNEIPYKNR